MSDNKQQYTVPAANVLTLNRVIRLVWVTVMSAIAVALLIGATQLLVKARSNPWEQIPFQGEVNNGMVVGSYIWNGQEFPLSFPGDTVPSKLEINSNDPSMLRLDGLTAKEQQRVAIRMLLLAGAILLIAWYITYVVWTKGKLVSIV